MTKIIGADTLLPAQILDASQKGWHEWSCDPGIQTGEGGIDNARRIREEGVDGWNRWVVDKSPEERRVLGNYQTNLCGLNLAGLDFRWVNGFKARMMGNNLARANFQFANLTRAHMEGTDAPNADFRGAMLNLAKFFPIPKNYNSCLHPTDRHLCPSLPVGRKTNLRGADFRGAQMFGVFLSEADLRRANFSGATMESMHFDDADLTGANFDRKQVEENLKELLKARTRIYGGFPTLAQVLKAAEIDPKENRAAAVELIDRLLTTDRHRRPEQETARHR